MSCDKDSYQVEIDESISDEPIISHARYPMKPYSACLKGSWCKGQNPLDYLPEAPKDYDRNEAIEYAKEMKMLKKQLML